MVVNSPECQKVARVKFVMKARLQKLGKARAASIVLFNKALVLSESEQIQEHLRNECRKLSEELRQMMMQMTECQPVEKLLEVPCKCGVLGMIRHIGNELAKVDWCRKFSDCARQIDSDEMRHISGQVERNMTLEGLDSKLPEIFGSERDVLFNKYFDEAVALEAIVHAATFEQRAKDFFKLIDPDNTSVPVQAPPPVKEEVVDEETERLRKILDGVDKEIEDAFQNLAKLENKGKSELQELRKHLNDPKKKVSWWEAANKEWAQKLAQENRTEAPKPQTENPRGSAPVKRGFRVETTPVSSGATAVKPHMDKLNAPLQRLHRLPLSDNRTQYPTPEELAATLQRLSQYATRIAEKQREFDQVLRTVT